MQRVKPLVSETDPQIGTKHHKESVLNCSAFKSDAHEMLRIAFRHCKKNVGRRGLPQSIVTRMYFDYLRLGSLQKVGRLYNRSRQAVWGLFSAHHLPMNARNFHGRIIFAGEAWTPAKGGYYRPTTGDRTRRLHRVIWEKRTGRKVPDGWQVSFKNGDESDIRFANLICLPIEEVSLFHYRRRFPDRARFSREERREFWKAHYRELARKKAKAFKRRGLRCDGKPMVRTRNLHGKCGVEGTERQPRELEASIA